MDEKCEEDINNRIINCILMQTFLEVRFSGIEKIPFFKEILSLEELILFDIYKELVLGRFRDISKKLDCVLSEEHISRKILEDLQYLETNQIVVNRFFLEIQNRVRKKITFFQRMKFLWENIKIIFSKGS